MYCTSGPGVESVLSRLASNCSTIAKWAGVVETTRLLVRSSAEMLNGGAVASLRVRLCCLMMSSKSVPNDVASWVASLLVSGKIRMTVPVSSAPLSSSLIRLMTSGMSCAGPWTSRLLVFVSGVTVTPPLLVAPPVPVQALRRPEPPPPEELIHLLTADASVVASALSSLTISMEVLTPLSSVSNLSISVLAMTTFSGGPWTMIELALIIAPTRTGTACLLPPRATRPCMNRLAVSSPSMVSRIGTSSSALAYVSLNVSVLTSTSPICWSFSISFSISTNCTLVAETMRRLAVTSASKRGSDVRAVVVDERP